MAAEKVKAIAQIQYEKKIHCLCQQLQEYTKQIELLQVDIDRLRARLAECCREQDELKRQLTQSYDVLACYESKFQEMCYELKEKANQRLVDTLQEKVAFYHEQLQQKESCLITCKNDVKTRAAALEEARNDITCELQQKESAIKQMKEDLRHMYEDLKCKSEDNCQLERNVTDLRAKLNQTCCQLKEADGRLACLHDKVQQMEYQNSRDKSQVLKELEEFERKIAQGCSDLCACQTENRRLRRCLQDQLQVLPAECNDTKQELVCCQRELEKNRRETDDLRMALQDLNSREDRNNNATDEERSLKNLWNEIKYIFFLYRMGIVADKLIHMAICLIIILLVLNYFL